MVVLVVADAVREIDLLSAIGIPEDTKVGVTYTAGLDGYPTFLITSQAFIREPAQLFFRQPLFSEFAITLTVQPYRKEGGFVFAVVNPYQTIISFGVQIMEYDSTQQNVALYFTPNTRIAEQSEVIANFTVPSMVRKWNKLSFKVLRDRIVLYYNCQEYEQSYWFRTVENLDFEPGSSLYIGQAGPNFQRTIPSFEVSALVTCMSVSLLCRKVLYVGWWWGEGGRESMRFGSKELRYFFVLEFCFGCCL